MATLSACEGESSPPRSVYSERDLAQFAPNQTDPPFRFLLRKKTAPRTRFELSSHVTRTYSCLHRQKPLDAAT